MEFTKREKILSVAVILMLLLLIGSQYLTSHWKEPQITVYKEDSHRKITDEQADKETNHEQEEKIIMVDVCGEVFQPGVVSLKDGARVIDAVKAAGGLLDTADRRQINLARIVTDGEQVYIPKIGENMMEQGNKNMNQDTAMPVQKKGKININTASVAELETLNGIGKVLAERIVQYRQENGNFKEIKDIMKVSGIGEKKYEGIKDCITTQ
ncbi:helix-hairpin-helix domain-containing protein [Thermotalea metallivorans]|uniref:ComE operon protein 1 n=1 Tax=Thermotalea metallivorans TaxID=520762 RepID=A0A140L905_9FIRM|nr:helix-hairpin-helix domain-containing protein [Thermotalea metallivorans]KXG77030.1 ComE operon protein 1 [Thermotalea metallivorans]